MANIVGGFSVHEKRFRGPGQPAVRWRIQLLWTAFLAILIAGVLGGAEVGLRIRRDWIVAQLNPPSIDDSRFVGDRLLHYTNRPGYAFESQEADGSVLHYTNNSLGLRGPEVPRAKPPGMKRVILVGGSTVYGALVDDADTISVQLEELLRARLGANVQVINGGVPGYVGLQELLFARSGIADLQPDVLVDLDGLNDVFYGSLQEWPAQIAADELGILAERCFPEVVAMVDSTMFPNGLLEHHFTMLQRDLRRSMGMAINHHPPVEPRVNSERVVALHAGALGLLARYGHAAAIHVIAGLQPLMATGHKHLAPEEQAAVVREEYWSEGGWQQIAVDMYPRIAETTRDAVMADGGRFVDLTAVFDDETAAAYAGDAVHYTPLGNRLVAEALAGLVEEDLRAPRLAE